MPELITVRLFIDVLGGGFDDRHHPTYTITVLHICVEARPRCWVSVWGFIFMPRHTAHSIRISNQPAISQYIKHTQKQKSRLLRIYLMPQ
jgi:hypothetical protein